MRLLWGGAPYQGWVLEGVDGGEGGESVGGKGGNCICGGVGLAPPRSQMSRLVIVESPTGDDVDKVGDDVADWGGDDARKDTVLAPPQDQEDDSSLIESARLPKVKSVVKQGHVCHFSRDVTKEYLKMVLTTRKAVVDKAERELKCPILYLPFKYQKQAQHALQVEWQAGMGQEKVRELATKWGDGTDRFLRNLASAYRSYQHEMLGGREWVNILIATGDVDDAVLGIMNDVIKEKVEERASCTAAEAEPRQKKRKDRDDPEIVKGIQHKNSDPKYWRDQAKKLDKKMGRELALYEVGRSRMGLRAWNQLVAETDAMWDYAEKLSEEAGFPYKDRLGNWQNNERNDLTTKVPVF